MRKYLRCFIVLPLVFLVLLVVATRASALSTPPTSVAWTGPKCVGEDTRFRINFVNKHPNKYKRVWYAWTTESGSGGSTAIALPPDSKFTDYTTIKAGDQIDWIAAYANHGTKYKLFEAENIDSLECS